MHLLKVPESKRTPGMRAIIRQERLQLEIGKNMMDHSRFRRLVEVGASQGIGVQDFGQSNNCLMKVIPRSRPRSSHLAVVLPLNLAHVSAQVVACRSALPV